MIQHRAFQLRLFAPAPDHWIVTRVLAYRRVGMRYIWNSEEQIFLLLVRHGRLLVQESDLIANLPYARLQFLCRFAFRAFPADLLAQPLAIAIELLQRRLGFAPFRVHPQHLVDLRRVIAAARRQPAFYKVGLFANEPDIEHGLEYQRD